MNQLLAKVEFKFSGGVLRVIKCEKEEQFTFLDYIFNGLEMSLILAIDFTGSNGQPSLPTSFHYFDMGNRNKCDRA